MVGGCGGGGNGGDNDIGCDCGSGGGGGGGGGGSFGGGDDNDDGDNDNDYVHFFTSQQVNPNKSGLVWFWLKILAVSRGTLRDGHTTTSIKEVIFTARCSHRRV